jgi:hypothetical protein
LIENLEKKFYVYALLDPRKKGDFSYGGFNFIAEPFYIGKGQGNRMNHHVYRRNKGNNHKNNKIKAILLEGMEPIATKVIESLSESEALKSEENLIEVIGRSRDKKGPLTNFFKNDEESKRFRDEKANIKISQKLKGRFLGRKLTPQWRNRIRKNNAKFWLGKHLSESTKEKLRQAVEIQDFSYRRNKYELESPKGETFTTNNLKLFCKEQNLSRTKIMSISTGKRKYYKGWKCKRLTNWRDGYILKTIRVKG